MEKNKALDIYNKISTMFPDAKCELNYNNPYELLISTLLSQQTTDKRVNEVTKALFEKYPDCYTLKEADLKNIEDIIRPIGLYHNKAINIIILAKQIVTDYSGVIPNTFEDLIKLRGVGRKTANVVLAEAFDIPRIAVDTHVLRVSNRLGFISSNNPVEVENCLMDYFPEQDWKNVHLRLLFFGRYFCKAINPMCKDCFYKNNCLYKQKTT